MNPLGVAWMVVGTALVLLGPGWAWSLAVFPRNRPLGAARTAKDELDMVERAAVALVLSLVLAPFGAIVWSGVLHLPLGTLGSIAMLAVLTGGGLAVRRWAPGLLAARADPRDADEAPPA